MEVNEWKAKFDDALLKLKDMDGESAKELEEQLDTLFAIAPPKSSEMRCSTPPTVPDAVTSVVTIPVKQGAAMVAGSHVVSPYDRPKYIPPLVTSSSAQGNINFPVLQDTIKANNAGVLPGSDSTISPRVETRQMKQQHLTEIITRPAVKITGAVTNPVNTPLPNIESVCDDLLQVVPDSCLSLTEKKTMPFPEACPSLVPSAPEVTASTDAATMAAAAADVMNSMPSVDSGATVSTDESDEDSDLGEFLLDAVQWL
jgi:hypothetical protein